MENFNLLLDEIILCTSLSKRMKRVANKLHKSCIAGKFRLATVSCLEYLSELAYLLYVYGKVGLAKKICEIVENEEYIPSKSALWTPTTQLLVLLMKINEELMETDKNIAIADKIKLAYIDAKKALNRRLQGDLLEDEKIKGALFENDIAAANDYRFGQLSELCFILEIGDKSEIKMERLNSKIQDIKNILSESKF